MLVAVATCGVVKNCSAWFVLVNMGFVERSAFSQSSVAVSLGWL